MPLQVWDKAAFDWNYRTRTGFRVGHPVAEAGQHFKQHYVRNIRRNVWAPAVANRLITALGLVNTDNILLVGAGYGWLGEAFVNDLSWVGNVICIDSGAYIQATKADTESVDLNDLFTEHQDSYIVQSLIADPSQVPGGAGKMVDTVQFDTPGPGQITITFTDATGAVVLRTAFDAQIVVAGLDQTQGNGLSILNALLGDAGAKARLPIENEDLSNNGSRNRVRNLNGGVNYDWAITERVLESLDDAECSNLSSWMHLVATNVAHTVEFFHPAKFDPAEVSLWNWKWPNAAFAQLPKWSSEYEKVYGVPQPSSLTAPELAAQPWYTTTEWKTLLPSDSIIWVGNYGVF